jgi:signal transduction histidine kinase
VFSPAAIRNVTVVQRVIRALRRERIADLLLWVGIAAPVLVLAEAPAPGAPAGLPLLWVQIAAVPLLGIAAFVARRMPLAAAAVPPALGLAVKPDMYNSGFILAQVLLVYLLGRRAPGQRGAWGFFPAVYATGLLLLLLTPNATVRDGFTLASNVLLTLVLPWLAGQYVRQRAELVRAGWRLAERLEQEQELVADRVRLSERSRIAEDMHDSLGHELSLIALRAATLQVDDGLGPKQRQAAKELRQAAETATERLREVIGVLREDGEPAPVLPAGETVASLVERAAASGVPVRLDDRLLPPVNGAAAPLPPMTDRAIYRVVQEALTNATKHAPGAPVTVTLCRDGAQATVTVVNEAAPGGPPPGPSGGSGGYGLVRLDERVRQAGGTLHARPTGGGFTVTARLPLAAGARATPPGGTRVRPRETAVARRTALRRMIYTVWLPAAAAVVLLLVMIFYESHLARDTVLDEQVYEQLRVGERQSSVEQRLPAHQARPERRPADPPGTDECRVYRASLDEPSPAYRLCFTDGRLSHKDKDTVVFGG